MAGICFLVAFFASVLGKICGMGGGVIIKPVLDAYQAASMAAIHFYSGCTVLGMSCWSVGKAVWKKDSQLDFRVSTPLAVGAAVGGLLGKELYTRLTGGLPDADMVGGLQALLLFAATLATLIYTIFRRRFSAKQIQGLLPCAAIGLALGALGSFLGIGGGPFNVAALYYFFAMSAKAAAQNSLYIILISQAAGTVKTILSGEVPEIMLPVLLGMILCGILGSEVGGRLNCRLSEKKVSLLFQGAMVLVLGLNLYNMYRFFG